MTACQDFISLNFDSYRQYALEREREDRIHHLTYGNVDKQQSQSQQQQGHSYHQDGSPIAHFQYPSLMTPLPAPDHFHSSRHNIASHNMINSESDYDDGETMDPAPGESDTPPSSIGAAGLLALAAVDLSTDKRRYQQPQEPNSTTVTEYSAGAYYGGESQCGRGESTIPDSALLDEGPTDLSTEKKIKDDHVSLYHGSVAAHGSILGGILSAHIPPKIKAEIIDEDESGNCYIPYARSSTASTDSSCKDKEYSSQSLWSAGTMTTVVGGAASGSAGSTDEITEEVPRRTKGRRKSTNKKEKAAELKKYPLCNDSSSEALKKTSAAYSPGTGSGRGGHKKRRGSQEENSAASSSTSTTPLEGTSSTTSSSGRKGSSANSNASKQCRFCGKTFQWLHSVKTHERLHTGIKPYACKICGARFTQNGNLKVHAKTCVEKHAETYKSRNVLICSVCTEMFSDTDALMDHQKSHDRMQWTIKEKSCQMCGEVFQKRSFLLEHEKVYVQERSFLSSLGIEAEAKDSGETSSTSPTTGTTGNVAE